MSHKATNWLSSVAPDAMTHGEFRILFHLCDCHNPSQGCYPSQEYLRDHTGLSNGGLNKALGNLEEKGLIRRVQQSDKKTKRRTSTRYILGCDEDLAQKPTPLSGDGANSTFEAEPSPLLAQSHLHPSGDKPVKEPVKEPVAAGAAQDPDFDFSGFFAEFIETHPRIGDLDATEAELRTAIEGGADPEAILAGARAYATEQEGNAARFIAYSENWIAKERWKQHRTAATGPKASEADILRVKAQPIIKGQEFAVAHTTDAEARRMVELELVTIDQCRAVGIKL